MADFPDAANNNLDAAQNIPEPVQDLPAAQEPEPVQNIPEPEENIAAQDPYEDMPALAPEDDMPAINPRLPMIEARIHRHIAHGFIDEEKNDDPDEPVINIHLNSPPKNMCGISSTAKFDDQNLNISLELKREAITCCVDQEVIIKKTIFRCINGHPLCGDCILNMRKVDDNSCPICRSSDIHRDILMEGILYRMVTECEFSKAGCTFESYPFDMKEHTVSCLYADIECPWCKLSITSADLMLHCKNVCVSGLFHEFDHMESIDSLRDQKYKRGFIWSKLNKNTVIFIEKNNLGDCTLTCIQLEYDILLTNVAVTFKKSCLKECENIRINSPSRLIAREILYCKVLTAEQLKGFISFHISGFDPKYKIGDRYMVLNRFDQWCRATVIWIYGWDKIQVAYDNVILSDELVNVVDRYGRTRVQPLTMNNGMTSAELLHYINSLPENDQLQWALEHSVDNT